MLDILIMYESKDVVLSDGHLMIVTCLISREVSRLPSCCSFKVGWGVESQSQRFISCESIHHQLARHARCNLASIHDLMASI